jgi:hypothetical protein
MYARVTSFKVDSARVGELADKIKEMTPVAKALPGVVDVYVAWRADGQGVVAAIYRSKDDANKAVARIQALWGTLASLLQGAPATNIYDQGRAHGGVSACVVMAVARRAAPCCAHMRSGSPGPRQLFWKFTPPSAGQTRGQPGTTPSTRQAG